jgi:type I site-specific restriction endonuclease
MYTLSYIYTQNIRVYMSVITALFNKVYLINNNNKIIKGFYDVILINKLEID